MNGWHTFYKTCIVALTLVAGYLLWELREIVIVLFGALIFASTIRPYVNFLALHRVPQGLAVLIIYLAVFCGLIALLVISVPPLARFTIDLMDNELLVAQFRALLGDLFLFLWDRFEVWVPVWQVPEQLEGIMAEANVAARDQALPVAMTTATGLGQILLALVMSFYWLTTRQQLLDLLLHLSPVRHRARTGIVWNDIEQTLGAYVRGQVILVFAIGIAAFIGLLIFRVPYALPLAVIAGLTEVIPFVGPILGAVPAVLIAFTDAPVKGLLVAAWYILIQQVESNVLVPKVMESNVGLNPLLVIIAIVAGGTLNGIVGALLAIPIAGALQVIAKHLLIDPTLNRRQWRTTEEGVLLKEEEEEPEEPAAAPVIPTAKS